MKKFYKISVATFLSLGLFSCSMFHDGTTTNEQKSQASREMRAAKAEKTIQAKAEKETAMAAEKTKKEAKAAKETFEDEVATKKQKALKGGQKAKGGKGIKKESVLPTDREDIVKAVSSVYTSEDIAKGILKGDWAIETVNGEEAVGEKAPFLKFDPATGKLYGNNGCNVINAQYAYDPEDHTIQFSYLSTTMRLCHKEGITDIDINRALDATRTYSCELSGDDYYLRFFDEDGEEIMTLMHQNFQFLNGTWAVKQISGEDVNVAKMKLVIDVEEGKLHGNTGCNVINGAFETNMDAPNSISFNGIAKTMMLCPDENYEIGLLAALEEAMKAKPLKGNKVELLDSQNRVVLVLERTSDK